jgi:hypothetical protein
MVRQQEETTMIRDEAVRMFETPLGTEAVVAIIANDLPQMTEAQLAELLTNLFLDGPSEVADALAPMARLELTRRRFIEHVERIVAAV